MAKTHDAQGPNGLNADAAGKLPKLIDVLFHLFSSFLPEIMALWTRPSQG
jgi:hypothetical protein